MLQESSCGLTKMKRLFVVRRVIGKRVLGIRSCWEDNVRGSLRKRAGLRYVGTLDKLITWHPLKSIFFKLFLV